MSFPIVAGVSPCQDRQVMVSDSPSGTALTNNGRSMRNLSLSMGRGCVRPVAGILKPKAQSYELDDFQRAGVAWVERQPLPGHTRGEISYPSLYVTHLYVWCTRDSFELLWEDYITGCPSFELVKRGELDAISSTPMGQFATMLDAAIARARTTPMSHEGPGALIPSNESTVGHLVWIPSLGASNAV